MARKTSLKESTRRKGQLRIDQQKAARKLKREAEARKQFGGAVTAKEVAAVAKAKKKKKKAPAKGNIPSSLFGLREKIQKRRRKFE